MPIEATNPTTWEIRASPALDADGEHRAGGEGEGGSGSGSPGVPGGTSGAGVVTLINEMTELIKACH
ncbi:hypothetical protein KSP40_PGU009475 [Platanthera guangdongensis]|uniref:Uncharacterized protein n=1 Tax=Platanthera guangdongensis TaxID=2320717 RepID=A0ABR2LMK4_9ASPA